MLNVAIAGCAHIHTPFFIKRLLARSNEVKIVGVFDHDAVRAAKNAEATGAPVLKLDEIMQNDNIQLVIICSETNLHEELVTKAINGGKNIYVEKPLGFAAEDAARMADKIDKAGVLFNTGYMRRSSPDFILLRKLIAQKAFGTITRVRLSNCHSGSLGKWFDTDWRWMADPKIAGCGAFGDLGTHILDILLWWFGSPAKVTADIRTVTGHYPDCDETGEAILSYKDGPIATLAAAWLDVADPVTTLISGTQGCATIINGQLFLKSENIPGADGKSPWTDLPKALPHPLDLLINAIAGDKDAPLVTPQEAAERSRIMESLYASAAQKSWVNC